MGLRFNGRAAEQLRDIRITRHYTRYAEGSVLIEFGHTKVICNVSIEDRVPRFLKGAGSGWITAEYSMLPRATHARTQRESQTGRQSGRTLEIQRLIGRSLRAVVDLKALGERTLTIDCDVIQADGGTRTAAITGSYVALVDAVRHLLNKKQLTKNPIYGAVAAVSVGIYKGQVILDLDYAEDSEAETDMNIILNDAGAFVEIQGTAEGHAFREEELQSMLNLAKDGIKTLLQKQQQALMD